tara:strand:- start:423 stop:641 length:219 start_codon:yes stop_codon:yes gene_type:complete
MGKVVRTSDGYTFYRQPDGSYKDTKDGKDYDISFDSLKKMKEELEDDIRVIEFKSGGLVRKGKPKLAKKGWK